MSETTAHRPLDVERVRKDFPALDEVVYLNCGTYGLTPEPALKVLLDLTSKLEHYGVACPVNVWERMESARTKLAGLLNASSDEVSLTRNATDGPNYVFSGMEWRRGDEVITSNEEHPAISHPLLYLQGTRGITVRFVETTPEPDEMLRRLDALATDRTRLVVMSHVSCESGTRMPAGAISAWAAERGVLSMFDGAQSFGAIAVDVKALGCDFYSANGHKWMCGPKGTGLLYGKLDRLLALRPAHVGAGSIEKADVKTGEAEPHPNARRFEFGTRSWAVYAGLEAVLDWFDALGWDTVREHMRSLGRYFRDQIRARPYLELLTPYEWDKSSGITCFSMPGVNNGELGTALREKWKMHTRGTMYNGTRISVACFVNQSDLDKLLSALDEIHDKGLPG